MKLNKNGKIVTQIFGVCILLVPFLLQSNMYPLFYYGMFSEVLHQTNQQERLVIETTNASDITEIFLASSIGMDEGHFLYVVRYYYYHNKSQQLFSQLNQILKKSKKFKRWKLYKIIEIPSEISDTVDIVLWKPESQVLEEY